MGKGIWCEFWCEFNCISSQTILIYEVIVVRSKARLCIKMYYWFYKRVFNEFILKISILVLLNNET